MAVYVIQAGDGGPVKIGFAADVFRRIVKMQADNHEPLTLVALFDGDVTDEAAIHVRFLSFHLRGEWFGPGVLARLDEIDLPPLPVGRKSPAMKPGMLRAWIAEQGLTQREAADRLAVHEITLNRWLNDKALPRRSQMVRVQQLTGGAVQPADFYAAA